jgi:hypothetical protein
MEWSSYGGKEPPPHVPRWEEFVLRAGFAAVKAKTTTALLGSELQPSKQPSVNPLKSNETEKEGENEGGSETLHLRGGSKIFPPPGLKVPKTH